MKIHRLERVALYQTISEKTGLKNNEIDEYKLMKCLKARMAIMGLTDVKAYLPMLNDTSGGNDEFSCLMSKVYNHHTYFMREFNQLCCFIEDCLPEYMARMGPRHKLKIWSAACATGEEPYSLAILLHSALAGTSGFHILATDIDHQSLNVARNGLYPFSLERKIPPLLLNRYFQKNDSGYQVQRNISDTVSFHHLNLLERRAIEQVGKVDFIFCRNVLFYFDLTTQQAVMANLNQQLNDGGFMFLSSSERMYSLSTNLSLRKFHSFHAFQMGSPHKASTLLPKLTVDDALKAMDQDTTSIAEKRKSVRDRSAATISNQTVKRQDLIDICAFVKKHSGVLLSRSNYSVMQKHLKQRMRITKSNGYQTYRNALFNETDNNELNQFIHPFLDESNDFFYDFEQLAFFAESCLPLIQKIKKQTGDMNIRLWVAGCSNAEEVYTLAIILSAMLEGEANWTFHIHATSFDAVGLDKARERTYREFELDPIPKEYIEQYFIESDSEYRIKETIYRMIHFEYLNFAEPLSTNSKRLFDVVFCRTGMNMLGKDSQINALNLFYQNLMTGGFLFLHRHFALKQTMPDMKMQRSESGYCKYN